MTYRSRVTPIFFCHQAARSDSLVAVRLFPLLHVDNAALFFLTIDPIEQLNVPANQSVAHFEPA